MLENFQSVSKKEPSNVGMILQSTIANAIRDATATTPRLLSPPVKAVLGNLGFVLQFAGVLLLSSSSCCNIIRRYNYSFRNLFNNSSIMLVTGFFLNSYGEKSSLNLQQASILVFS